MQYIDHVEVCVQIIVKRHFGTTDKFQIEIDIRWY